MYCAFLCIFSPVTLQIFIYEVVHSSEIFQSLIQTIVHIILQILLEILNLGHGQYTQTNVFIFIVNARLVSQPV